jgi:hypothetical protein
MRGAVTVTSVIVGLALGGLPPTPASAQTRVIVPIVIRQPGTVAPAAAARTSVEVTTRTVSPQAGVTRTDVRIRDTTGVAGYASGRTQTAEPGVSRVTIRDTTGVAGYGSTRPHSPQPGVTRVTIRDTTGVAGYASGRSQTTDPGVTRTHVTIQDTTGVNGFSSARPGWIRAGVPQPVDARSVPPGSPTVDDGSGVIVPVLVRRGPGGQPQSLTITTDGPIDTPIVILGQ